MYNFVFKRQPISFNSWVKDPFKGKNYKINIETSFKEFNKEHTPLAGDLYGVIFHFFNKNLKLDADNLSKPIWDCLQGFLYEDDFQVKIRTAGIFDLTVNNDFTILDFS